MPDSHSFSEHVLHDKDIRGPLFDFLEKTYGRIRIIEEKMSGRARADAVMVMPDKICGIEIKSDADTYARLAGQVKNYDMYYDMNFVVVGTRHAMHIEEHVPPYWGIITVEAVDAPAFEDDRDGATGDLNFAENGSKDLLLDFYMLRHPKINPNMEPEKKISILWRPELAHIQALDAMPAYKYLSKADDWSAKPAHTKHSHMMDALRYAVMGINEFQYFQLNADGSYKADWNATYSGFDDEVKENVDPWPSHWKKKEKKTDAGLYYYDAGW